MAVEFVDGIAYCSRCGEPWLDTDYDPTNGPGEDYAPSGLGYCPACGEPVSWDR